MYGAAFQVACLFAVIPFLLELTPAITAMTMPTPKHLETAVAAPATDSITRAWHSAAWQIVPSRLTGWDTDSRIPMINEAAEPENSISRIGRVDLIDAEEEARGKNKYYKKYKKYMLPLLLAYKLKFFTLVPILIGGLVLLTGATGLAGFFFALFAATMGLKGGGDH